MGFLGFGNYNKPGKGVSKDEPEKKGFFLYWDIVFHKFTKILGANTLYTLTSIIWLAFLAVIYVPMMINASPDDVVGLFSKLGQEIDADGASGLLRLVYINGAFLIFNFFGSGPVSASYAYIVRCFSNRQHVWIFSDGWDKFKENLKQSVVVLLINTVVLFAGGVAIKFYYALAASGQIVFAALLYVMVVLLIVFTWMQFYIYQLMVTVECTIKQLYKNAAIVAVTRLPMNILLTVIVGAVSLLPYMITSKFLTVLLFSGRIGMFFTRFVIEFYAARTVKKLVLNTAEGTESDTEEKVFDDDLAKKIKKEENK